MKTIVNANNSKLMHIFISVHTNTIVVYNSVFKFIHFGVRFRIYAFTVSFFIVFVWTEGLNAQKFPFTIVCVYNRLRVDGASVILIVTLTLILTTKVMLV